MRHSAIGRFASLNVDIGCRREQTVQRLADDFKDHVSSWSELADLIEHFSFFSGYDWLFRGVTDATHGLVPKIGRKKTRAMKKDYITKTRSLVPYRIEDERAVISMFRQQARAHLTFAPENKLQWLAVAQHFGLPTRLLDWTDSLLVAAWFAVEKGGAKKMDSAIWVTKEVPSVEIEFSGDPLDLDSPKAYRPPHHVSPRIGAQASVLMICPNPTQELSLPSARKIVIDRLAEFTIKKRLTACGMNRRHLFPDLIGLSEHLTWMYKNDWLAAHRKGTGPEFRAISDDEPDEAVE